MSSNLSYVLSKIQFGRITESTFTKNSDTLIELLNERYPNFISKQIEHVEIKIGPKGEQEIKKSSIPVITLITADNSWGIRITQDHILLHTSKYSSFKNLESRISEVLTAIETTMKIRHIAFIGLRYINKFNEKKFEACFKRKEFLQPFFDNLSMAGSNLTAQYKDNEISINVNSGVLINNFEYPGDLIELTNDLKLENKTCNGPWAHLDIDAFITNKILQKYKLEDTIKTLKKLNEQANYIYNTIVTNVA